MTTLDELIAPYGAGEFLGAVWGQRMELLPGPPDRFAGLLPWAALNDILRRHRLEIPRLRLAHGGERVPEEDYTTEVQLRRGGTYRKIKFDELSVRMKAGATLVIDSIDELYGPIDDLAGDLERLLRERVQVNCYASFGAVHGFDTHWDDHDVLAVQVHGRKRWRVFGPTRPYPQRRDVSHPAPPEGEPAHDVILSTGGVLHVPRGWWHDATALDEPSVHLTFGVTGATGADLISWLADELRRLEIVRQDLPRFAGQEQREIRLKELADAVAGELADATVLDRFFEIRDAQAPPRGYPSLPWTALANFPGPGDAVEAATAVRMVVPRAVISERDGQVWVLADGRRAKFLAAAGPVLHALADGRTHDFGELAKTSGLPPATVRGLSAELVKLGFAALS
ncbi:MAG TPA: cupin domain-containing protein [Streptosporangiaceae bacterium]|jgi:hypothetical protein